MILDSIDILNLVKQIYPKLLRIGRISKLDKFEIEDSIYEAIYQLIQNSDSLLRTIDSTNSKKNDFILSYLYSTAKSFLFKNHLISANKTINHELIDLQSNERNPLEIIEDKEKKAILAYALDKVKKEEKEYLEYLVFNPDKTIAEFAESFGITVSVATRKKYRLIRRLKELVEEVYKEREKNG